MSMEPTVPVTSLYVHVPFCARKCQYCAFYSEASDGKIIQRYVNALIREMELAAHDLRPQTIFFGGGTPSLLNLGQWETILQAMDRLGLLGAAEWTLECNPATVSLDKAKLWHSRGINRVSMGVQAFDDALLARLGRIHSREGALRSFDILRRGGFENINLDLMFAIPGQTLEIWRDTLRQALALGSEHLSCYELIYEEDTPLYKQLQAGQLSVDEDLSCSMYEELLEQAARHGFEQYEIANFARQNKSRLPSPPRSEHGFGASLGAALPLSPPAGSLAMNLKAVVARTGSPPCRGLPIRDTADCQSAVVSTASRAQSTTTVGQGILSRSDGMRGRSELPSQTFPSSHSGGFDNIPTHACRHNINYWRGGSYIGLGPSAAGHVRGLRTKNCANTILYCEQLEQGKRPIEWREKLPPLAWAGETAAFGLRMNAGWPFALFQRVTGFDLRTQWKTEVDQLVAQDWGHADRERFRLTLRGLRFADAAAELFLR